VLSDASDLRTNKGDVFMPAFGAAYAGPELAALVNCVVGHFGGSRSSITAAGTAAARRPA
jgi:hypothetical protein